MKPRTVDDVLNEVRGLATDAERVTALAHEVVCKDLECMLLRVKIRELETAQGNRDKRERTPSFAIAQAICNAT